MKIHKRAKRFGSGVLCNCRKPLCITNRWNMVTCDKCNEYNPWARNNKKPDMEKLKLWWLKK